MEFVKAMRIRNRICKTVKEQHYPDNDCSNCPLSAKNNPKGIACMAFITETPELAEPFLELWDREHPVPTRADKLRELCPNARTFHTDIPVICPLDINADYQCAYDKYSDDNDVICLECRRDFWTAEWEVEK